MTALLAGWPANLAGGPQAGRLDLPTSIDHGSGYTTTTQINREEEQSELTGKEFRNERVGTYSKLSKESQEDVVASVQGHVRSAPEVFEVF